MRAIIYTRVSSDKSGQSRSVDEQEADCRHICEINGWPVAEVISDNDMSASRYARKERPGFLRLWEVLRKGDVLVLWEASRAQRDLKAYLELRDLCHDRGVLLSYSGRTYDLSEGEDRFSTGLDALMAERYAEEMRVRVMRAQRANLDKGRPHGRIPFGYQVVRDDRGRPLERIPDPVKGPIVQEAYMRLLAGEALYSIAQDFERRDLCRYGGSKHWNQTILGYILRRPTYAGLRTHQGKVVGDGTWEGLVSKKDWYEAQKVLGQASRKTSPGPAPAHLLSGIAVCGVCGNTLERLKDRRRAVYICKSPQRHTSRPLEALDEYVTEHILFLLRDPRTVALLSADDTELDSVDDTLALIEDLQARLDDFAESAANGEITPAMLAKVERNLTAQIEEARGRLSSASLDPVLAQVAGPDADALWGKLDLLQKRAVIRTAVEVVVHPVGRGRRGYDISESVDISWRE